MMRLLIRNIIFVLCFSVTLIRCSLSDDYYHGFYDVHTDSSVIALFETYGFNMGSYLGLQEHDKFVYSELYASCDGYIERVRIRGTYTNNNDSIIKLLPDSFIKLTFDEEIDSRSYDSIAFDSVSGFDFKTTYHRFNIEFKEYLLSDDNENDNDFYKLANDYNSNFKIPPLKKWSFYFARYDSTGIYNKFNVGIFPSKYQKLFLEKGIQAKIVKIDTLPEKYSNNSLHRLQIHLDKGSHDLVWEGMMFYKLNDGSILVVDEISDFNSSGKVLTNDYQKLELGETMSTINNAH